MSGPSRSGPPSAGSGGGRAWQPNTAYKAGDVVEQAGALYYANADFTSGATFNAANWTAVGGGGGAPAGPEVLSAATTTGDQSAGIQAELDALSAAGGGILRLPKGTLTLTASRARTITGYGSVTAILHLPYNVQLKGAGATEGTTLRFTDSGLTTGDACIATTIAGGGRLEHDVLCDLTVTTVTATPPSFRSTALPPTAPWGVLLYRGDISNIWFEGNLRASVATIGDHNTLHKIRFGGYAGIEYPTGFITIGDVTLWDCIFSSSGCNILLPGVTGTNRAIQSMVAMRTHFGNANACIYAPASVSGQTLVSSMKCVGCSIEAPSRGFIVDPNRLGSVTDLSLDHLFTNTYFFAEPAPTDAPLPVGPFIQAGAITDLHVTGPAIFTNPGPDPTAGCVFDVTSIVNSDLGEIGAALDVCDRFGVPFMKCSGNLRNVAATVSTTIGGATRRAKVALAKSTTAIARGDVLRQQTFMTSETVRKFDAIGAMPAGIALASLPSTGGVVPYVSSGPAAPNVAHLGQGTLSASTTLNAIPAVSGSTTLAADLDLGSGAPPPRLAETATVGATTLKITAGVTRLNGAYASGATATVDSTTNFPAAGSVNIGGSEYSYTGKTATTLTGMTLVAGAGGTIPDGTFVASYGDLPRAGTTISVSTNIITYTGMSVDAAGVLSLTGIPASGAGSIATANSTGTPVGRVAVVAANASFGAGGVAKVGTTYFHFTGKSGTTYLYGVSSMVTTATTLLSGATVTEVNKITLKGVAEGYKTANGSAVMRSAPNDQFLYGAVLFPKLLSATAAIQSILADIPANASATAYNTDSYVTGGTRLNGAVTLPVATITVYDTTGFPSSGTLLVGGQTVTYTGRTATTFTGCSGGTGAIADGSAVTPKPQTVVTGGEKFIRPRYATGATDAEDQGLVTVASSHVDANGVPIGLSNAVDDGPVVVTRVALTV